MKRWSRLGVGMLHWMVAIGLGFMIYHLIGIEWLVLLSPFMLFFAAWGVVLILDNIHEVYTERKKRNKQIIVMIGKELLKIDVVTELDYVLLSNKERTIYGYGKTLNEALSMLTDDFEIDKEFEMNEKEKQA